VGAKQGCTPAFSRSHVPTFPPVVLSVAMRNLLCGMALVVAASIDARQDYLRPVDTPKTELLWLNGAPDALGAEDVDKPALTLYQPAKAQATGTIVVICPGGAYGGLAIDHEGHQVARWLTAHGVAGAVVKYRLGPRYHHPAPLQDVLRAIRVVRSRAAELGVKPDRVGVLGFSAGGHLASSAATLFDLAEAKVNDGLEAVSSRPDFAILGYPVIVFGADVTHKGSQRNLLGDNPSADLVTRLSTDRQVTAKTPPTFLFHTTDDASVPPQNSLAFYLALKNAGVPAELHIYERGRHGVGLAPEDRALSTWPDLMLAWMRGRGLLTN
jgi:acetyl esterase/lipase